MEYKRDNVVSLAQALKETISVEFKERARQAVQDSAKIAREGKRKLGDLRARLEFCSFDSKVGSYRGPAGLAAEAGPESRPLSGAPERGRGSKGGSPPAATDLAALLHGWGQLRANDNGWPTFDG
jgi:hypothetical protein